MRILFFTHYFPPEVNAPATRTFEHCREWAARGHEVHVVTCVPSHPIGRPFAGYKRRWYAYENADGIHVHRVWTYLAANRGVLRRTLNFISFIPTAVFRALRLERFDVAIGTSPQFFCAVATWVYAKVARVPWVFELRDLWPESIPVVGAMQPSFALRVLSALELRMYRDATAIVSTSDSFCTRLVDRGIPGSKLHFVPNGIDPDFWSGIPKMDARRAAGLADTDVLASYVGTIGMAHGLSSVLEAASRLHTSHPAIRFLIAGDGAELERLKAEAARLGLRNLSFTGLVKRDKVRELLAATDIAVITLKPSDMFKLVLPSKMFEAMAAECAIVLAVEGEARAILERAGAGIPVRPGDPDALAQAIAELAADTERRSRMASDGKTFVKTQFNRKIWASRYLQILASLADNQGREGIRAVSTD